MGSVQEKQKSGGERLSLCDSVREANITHSSLHTGSQNLESFQNPSHKHDHDHDGDAFTFQAYSLCFFFSLYFWISYHHSVSLGHFSFKYWEKIKPLEIVGYELGVFFI